MPTFNALLVLEAAAAVAGGQEYPRSALYVVATPIGNLADMSLRSLHVLALVDAVACEDKRHSAPLLQWFGIDKPLLALHQHNERAAASEVITRLARGQRVAYVSDAGTPAVSDPGARLVDAVRQAGYRCIPLPGASSILAAFSVAGDPLAQGFVFLGFAPARGAARTQWLELLCERPEMQVLFEAPHRIEALAKALALGCGTRTVTVCRELTKQFESVDSMQAGSLPLWFAADSNRRRGEFVLIVHAFAPSTTEGNAAQDETMLQVLVEELPLKQAVGVAARLSKTPRNTLYETALKLKARSG